MTVHAGICHRTNRAIGEEAIRDLFRTLAWRCTDGLSAHVAESVCLAWGGSNPEVSAALCSQPLRTDRHLITFDGRIDNREELLGEMNLPRDACDRKLVLTVIAAWGVHRLDRMIGDWALAAWDRNTRELILARDFLGSRPMHYVVSGGTVLWSSELSTLTGLLFATWRLNRDYLGQFLTEFPSADATPFDGIHAVPPGSWMRFTQDGRVTTGRYWRPSLQREYSGWSAADFEEEFRRLLMASVAARTIRSGDVWAELSGGLDSSSVVCLAHRHLSSSDNPSRLRLVSYVFPRSRSADEREYIGAIERHCGAVATTISEDDVQLFSLDGIVGPYERPHVAPGRLIELDKRMAQGGARVLLTGRGGDVTAGSEWGPHLDLSDLLVSARLGEFGRRLRAYHRRDNRSYWQLLVKDAIPRAVRPLEAIDKAGAPEFIHHDVSRRLKHWREEARARKESLCQGVLPSRIARWSQMCDVIRIVSAGAFRSCTQIEPTYPWLDRNLVEFMITVPYEHRLTVGWNRALQRAALSGLVPREVLTRREKTSAVEPLCRALSREWDQLEPLVSDRSAIAQEGFVDAPRLRVALEHARSGTVGDVFSLVRAVSLEIWLRSLGSHQDSSQNRRLPRLESTMKGGDKLWHMRSLN